MSEDFDDLDDHHHRHGESEEDHGWEQEAMDSETENEFAIIARIAEQQREYDRSLRKPSVLRFSWRPSKELRRHWADDECEEVLASDPEFLLKLDLPAELESFNIPQLSVSGYKHPALESHYVLFCTVHHKVVGVTGIVYTVGSIFDVATRVNHMHIAFTIARSILIAVLLAVTVAHMWKSGWYKRVASWVKSKPTQNLDDAGAAVFSPTKLGVATEAEVQKAIHCERLAVLMFFLFSALEIATYPSKAQCFNSRIAEGIPMGTAHQLCCRRVEEWPTALGVILVLVFRLRIKWMIALVFLPAAFLYGFRPTAHVDDSESLLFSILTTFIVSLMMIVFALLMDRGARSRFAAAMRYQRAAAKSSYHRQATADIINSLIPSVEKLGSYEPVVDVNHDCLLCVFRNQDFDRWSSTLMPDMTLCVMEIMYTKFDEVTSKYGVDKIAAAGDLYIVSNNLRPQPLSGDRALESGGPLLLKFALFQIKILTELRNHPHLQASCSAQVAIHCGPCIGLIVGTQRISYEVFGEGLITAIALSKCAPNDTAIISSPALRVIEDVSEFHVHSLPIGHVINYPIELQYMPLFAVRHLDDYASEPQSHMASISSFDASWNGSSSSTTWERMSGPRRRGWRKNTQTLADGDRRRFLFLKNWVDSRGEELKKQQLQTHEVLHSASKPSPWEADDNMSEQSTPSLEDSPDVSEGRVDGEAAAVDIASEEQPFAKTGSLFARYVNPNREQTYRAFVAVRMRFACVVSSAFVAVLALWFIGVAADTHTLTLSSLLLFISTILLCALRIIYRAALSKFPAKIPFCNYSGFLTVPMCTLLLAGVFNMRQGGIVNGRSPFLTYAIIVVAYLDGILYPGFVGYALIVISMLISFTFASIMHGLPDISTIITLTIITGGMFLPISARERQMRAHFEATLSAVAVQNADAELILTYNGLVEMMIPPALFDAVTKKAAGEAHFLQVIQWLSDVCVAGVRMESIALRSDTGAETLTRIRTITDKIDALLLSKQGLLEKFQPVGDCFFIAGPFNPSSGRSSNSFLNLQTGDRAVANAAVAMLDVIAALATTFSREVTAILTCSSSLAGVVGKTRPLFDICGQATRSVRAIVDAAPCGYIGVLPPMARLFEAAQVDTFSYGFQACPPTSWSVRGAGCQQVSKFELHSPTV